VQFGFCSALHTFYSGFIRGIARFYREERGASGTYGYDEALGSRHSQYIAFGVIFSYALDCECGAHLWPSTQKPALGALNDAMIARKADGIIVIIS